ncbi:response regulator transcription factor [Cohnella fermenti]|uniref:Response regulator n=1 Tax=Cohnella fermenti TaxID=2565925 RepID=A0A4S4C648_9BACL|nr:helix-turn-helix domain-containing protein [Cohnella fermenti]THF83255.1 response regulator [Cohnella fermenti]
MTRFKLLIAEDVKLVRETLARAVDWERLGIELIGAAENGEEALEWIDSRRQGLPDLSDLPDLLLTDIGMPKMNGIELIEAVRLRKPDIRCIILSGLSEFEFARQAIKLQVMDYILKPIDPEEIERVFAGIVADLRREREERRGIELLEQGLKEHLPNLAEALPPEQWTGNVKKKKLVEQAIGAVRRSYSCKELAVSDVAEQVGLSEKYVNALVKEVTGETINHWIVRLRMEEAARLLKDPANRIYEICDRIGYSDQDYFRETFKKHYGLTPSDYRNQYL